MAYLIGKKIVTDTKEFEDYAYGITLPIRRGNTGYFEQGFTTFEQAKSNLINLLKTRKGERIMQPEFGIGLESILFDPMTDELETKIEDMITESVGFWLPYVNIETIDVEMTDIMRDNHTSIISIEFSIGSDVQLNEVTFTIQG